MVQLKPLTQSIAQKMAAMTSFSTSGLRLGEVIVISWTGYEKGKHQ